MFNLLSLLWFILCFINIQLIWAAIRNTYFHPLSGFPGPRTAAATQWWRIVKELIFKQSLTELLPKLHAQYGEIVRIGPNELHFSNPEAFHEIYNRVVRWNKDPFIYHSFGADNASFGYLSVEEAKARKAILSPVFSKKVVNGYIKIIHEKVNRYCDILVRNEQKGLSSNLLFGPRTVALDIIMTLLFGLSLDSLESRDFRHPILSNLNESLPAFAALKFFRALAHSLHRVPGWLMYMISPASAGVVRFQQELLDIVTRVTRDPVLLENPHHPVIFRSLLDGSSHKGATIPFDSLYAEAQTLITGGIENVANTVMLGVWHLCQDESLVCSVQEELRTIWTNRAELPPLAQLEKLPLLTAIIKESLRMAPGVPHPLTRVIPSNGAVIQGRHIPGGTVVGMSTMLVHYSDKIYDDPDKFKPSRWLQSASSKELEHWLVPFSKGPRACLGINLAWAELYLIFAGLLGRFDIELDEPSSSDLEWKECFVPYFPHSPPRAFFHLPK